MGIARPAALLGAALLVAGCSSAPSAAWTNSTKEDADLRADQEDCKRFFGSSDRSVEQCLAAKGWKKTERKSSWF